MRYSKSIRNLKSDARTPTPELFKVQKEETLSITDEYITLSQFLKAVNVIGTGGEAKFYLAENVVRVNGEPEQRRGRKLRPGDLVFAPGANPTRLASSAGVCRVSGVKDTAEGETIQNPKSKIQNLNETKP